MADGRMQVGMILNSTTAEPAVPSELRRKRPEDMSKEDLPKTPPKKRLAHLPILFETFAHTYAQGQQHHTVEDAHSSPHHHGHASLPPNAWPAFSFCADNAPPRDVISRCIASFSRGYGDMYWLLPEDCIMDLFRGAYSPAVNRNNGDNANGGSLNHLESSLLLLCAAVGAVYLEDCDPTAAAHKEDFFLSGKAGLDAVVLEGRKVPDAVARLQISACALVALYDMFEKRISARGYIGQAIHLALSTGLDQTSPASTRPAMNQGAHGHAEMSAADVDSWSRVWRSLVFLDGWMSNSVGLAPVIDSNVLANGLYRGQEATEPDGGLNTEMANLGILMSAITRDVCSAAVIDMNFVRGHSENLKRWHDNLPHCLKLSEALGFQSNSSHRTSILLTHTAYLSSLILLTRRILVAHTRSLCPQGYINTVVNTAEDELLKLSHDCVYAARQLATVVSILFNEGRLVRRCWLGIQAAFTSCLVIFLELAVSIRDGGAALQQADVELASRCMYVLEYCAAADMIARSYLSAVVPIRNALFAISAAPPASPRIPPPQHIGSPPACVSPPALASPQAQGVPVGSGGYLSIDNVVTHVLEWLETPYGGESRIISEMPPNAPEHWRFLNASPPQLPTLGNTPHHSPYHGAQSPVSYGYLNDSRQSSPQPLPNSPQLKGIHGSPTPSHPSSPTHHSGKNPVLYRLQRTPSRYSTDPTSVACPGGPLPDVKMREPGSVNGSGRRKMPFKTMEEYEQFLKRVV